MRQHGGSARLRRVIVLVVMLILTTGLFKGDALSQKKSASPSSKVAPTEWAAYGRDAGGSRFSPLDQINRSNVKNLKVAWTYRTGDVSTGKNARSSSAFQSTPIMVDGTLYVTTPFNRVMALDPETGKERWTYDPKIDLQKGYDNQLNSRGLSMWVDSKLKPDQPGRRRIVIGTNDGRLIALDAATGTPCADFGENGQVDLARGVGVKRQGEYQVTSPPAVINDLVVVGSAIGDNQRVDAPSGVVRAYDVRTGKLRWSWDPVPANYKKPKPKEGEADYHLGTANVWSIISADPERDLVFLPVGNTSPDYYGGHREGIDYYSSSVVALRASTGKVVWHFQTVHHDVWDYDVPAQPALITVRQRGRREIPAVAVVTKMGHLFILNRETGKPIFPVEERPVPQGGVPGEKLSPTQPFPIPAHRLSPTELKPEDAFGLSEEAREDCRNQIKALRQEGIFTPPSLEGTLVYPGDVGGMNWSGVSFDDKHNLLIANTNRFARLVQLIPRKEFDPKDRAKYRRNPTSELASQTGTPYIMFREFLLHAGLGLFPCNPPPWGTLAAIDLVTGEKRWEVPLGVMPEFAGRPEAAQWGSINLGGSIVTAGGLVFIGAARDTYFRAFDVETGKELWKGELPAGGQATPMTYSVKGKQYVVIAAGGHGRALTKLGDYVVAFSLP